MISLFLQRCSCFAINPVTPLLPEHAHRLVMPRCLRPNPADGLDGFFAARLIEPGRL